MANPPDIEVYADGRPASTRSSFLAGRRLPIAAAIAVAEVIAIVIWGPGYILSTLIATALLALAAWASFKVVKKGLGRDILWVIALAQAMVVAIPLLLGASFVAAVIVGVLLLVGVLAYFARRRF